MVNKAIADASDLSVPILASGQKAKEREIGSSTMSSVHVLPNYFLSFTYIKRDTFQFIPELHLIVVLFGTNLVNNISTKHKKTH